MKTKGLSVRTGHFGSILFTLFVGGAVLFSPGWGVYRSMAQTFDGPPWGPGPKDESTASMGAFQVIVTTDQGVNLLLNAQISVAGNIGPDGTNWYPASLSGPVQLLITNNGTNGNLMLYGTQILQLTNRGSSIFGPVWLRQDPTNASVGQHTIQPGTGG